jgi:PAS domain S-box-containing protein
MTAPRKARAKIPSRRQATQTADMNANSSQMPFLDAVKAAIIITDAAGCITYWNPYADELYGWQSQEVLGRNIMNFTVSTETREEAEAHMAALNQGKAWSGEFQVRCKDDRFLTALVTLSAMVNEQGATVAIVGVSQDLSGRKRAEEELRQARAELEKQVQERTDELNRANEGLRDLSARLLQMRDQEARRLARELHDSVGQLLAAIGMNIAEVKAQSHKLDERGRGALDENTQLVEQITREIRTISHLLHPPLLDEAGLAAALRWYVEGFSERSKIPVDMEIPEDLGRLPTDIETAVFRIVQECLANIHRHSESKTAAVRFRQESDHVVVVAQDFGKGIPADKLHPNSDGRAGVGFRGMRERVRHLKGSLHIQSSATGTIVTAILPLPGESGAGDSDTFLPEFDD